VSSLKYASMNALGGVLAGTASALYGAWPGAAANFVWAVVGIHTLALCLHRKFIRRQSFSSDIVLTEPAGSDGERGVAAIGMAAQPAG
jgi:hypothetical protein